MAHEIRKIMFSADEVQLAFEGYRRLTPNFLPVGAIKGCAPQAAKGVIVTLDISGRQKADFTYGPLEVVRPMIRFCLENNIMLPRAGRKSVEILDGYVCLCILLDLEIMASLQSPDPQAITRAPIEEPIQS